MRSVLTIGKNKYIFCAWRVSIDFFKSLYFIFQLLSFPFSIMLVRLQFSTVVLLKNMLLPEVLFSRLQ